VLKTARYIKYITSAERDPVILPKPLDLSSKHVKDLSFNITVNRHHHAGGNGALITQ